MNNNNQNKNPKRRRGIWISFLTFFIISCMNSCQQMRVVERQKAGQALNLELPKLTYSEFFKESKEDLFEKLLEEKGLLEEPENTEEFNFSK